MWGRSGSTLSRVFPQEKHTLKDLLFCFGDQNLEIRSNILIQRHLLPGNMQLTNTCASAKPANAPNTLQWEIKNAAGEIYRVQVAFPLSWKRPNEAGSETSIMFVYALKNLRITTSN